MSMRAYQGLAHGHLEGSCAGSVHQWASEDRQRRAGRRRSCTRANRRLWSALCRCSCWRHGTRREEHEPGSQASPLFYPTPNRLSVAKNLLQLGAPGPAPHPMPRRLSAALSVPPNPIPPQLFVAKDVFRAVLYAHLDFEAPAWESLSPEAKGFVQSLLQARVLLRCAWSVP